MLRKIVAEHIQTYLKPSVVMIQSKLECKGAGAARYVVDIYHIVATINERFRRMIVLE